jgi:hypothetical protein
MLLVVSLLPQLQRSGVDGQPLGLLLTRICDSRLGGRKVYLGALKWFGAIRAILADVLAQKVFQACNGLARCRVSCHGCGRSLQLVLQQLGIFGNSLDLCLTHTGHRQE